MSEKEIKDIFSKVSFSTAYLVSVELDSLDPPSDSTQGATNLEHKWDYTIQNHTKDTLILTASFRLFFVPEAFFDIKLKYKVVFDIREEIFENEIRESAGSLLSACADINSLLVGELTDKMGYAPFILPPVAEVDKE